MILWMIYESFFTKYSPVTCSTSGELACEIVNTFIVNMLKRKMWRKKFQRDFHLGKDATFNFGIKESNEFEQWSKGIHFLDDWTFF